MRRFFAILSLLLLAFTAAAQDTVAPSRPKVGVVLSGGGAKGFAHIGALRVIEEAGIPVDYIAGTSMGSIIGGLYAVGYDPDMMQKLTTQQNWNSVLKDEFPRKYFPLEKRINDRHYILSMPYIDGKFKVNRSITDGVYINMLLTRLTLPAYKHRNFEELPVPFLCIGTDMITADPVEFRSGSLSQSIRSSMSIPLLFEPVEYDNSLFCDGGLTNNFPVRNVRERGADIIIGVDLEIVESDMNTLDNSLKVLERLISISSQEESNKARKECDILITPDIGKANMMSFDSFDTIIKCGEAGAREKFSELKKLADSLQSIAPFEVKRNHVQPVDSIYVTEVFVEGVDKYDADNIKSEFGDDFPRTFSVDEVETIIIKIYSQEYYSNIWYELIFTPEGNILKIHCKAKATHTLSMGAHYDNNYGMGVLLNISGKSRYVSYSADFNLSENYYVKAGATYRHNKVLRMGAEAYMMNLELDWYNNSNQLISILKYRQNSLDFNFQIVPSLNQHIIIGALANYVLFENKIYLLGETGKYKFMPNFYFHYLLNTEDKMDFVQRGWNVDLLGKCILYDGVFSTKYSKPAVSVQGIVRRSFMIGNEHSFKLSACGTFRPGDKTLPDPYIFLVGGQSKMKYIDNIISFTGLNFVNVVVESSAFAKTSWLWNFYKKFYTVVDCDFGYFAELFGDNKIYYSEDWITPDNFVIGAGLTLGVNTVLGPVELELSKSNINTDMIFFINLGFWF